MQINIRQATVADIQILSDISAETFTDTYAQFNTPENMRNHLQEHFNTDQLRKEIEDPDHIFLLAQKEEETIGFARLSKDHIPEEALALPALEIARIYVRKAYHGQQVGPLLMQYIIDFATEKQYKTLWLGVWERNPRAFRFYEKWNFVRFGEQIFQLGDDAQTDWLMRRDL